jgi:hypothetical protein
MCSSKHVKHYPTEAQALHKKPQVWTKLPRVQMHASQTAAPKLGMDHHHRVLMVDHVGALALFLQVTVLLMQ